MLNESYPHRYHRIREMLGNVMHEIPEVIEAFLEMHHDAMEDGALSHKTKELIALGIAITAHCDGCMSLHVHDALKAGATRQEITETIGVAVLMGGGPALMYGCEALEALSEFMVEMEPHTSG